MSDLFSRIPLGPFDSRQTCSTKFMVLDMFYL